MLNIFFGEMDDVIYNTRAFFDNQYLDCWLEDEFAAKVIKGIDKGTILSPQAVDTKALGVIPVTNIAGGTKTLLLIKNRPVLVFNASACGDDCARFLLMIGKEQDVTINLRHIMDFGRRPFTIRVLNTNTIIHNMAELVEAAVLYV